jgi:hypothetical protein
MTVPTAPGPEHRLRLSATVELARLEAEATHARERLQLYRAKTYGPRATDPSHLRELERVSQLADRRLGRARADYKAPNANEGAV